MAEELSYADALTELDDILNELEAVDVDVDRQPEYRLGAQVRARGRGRERRRTEGGEGEHCGEVCEAARSRRR